MSIFRNSVGILVWDNNREKLLTVNNRRWGGFSCPGGKIEPGEAAEVAAARELLEETGLVALSLREVSTFPHKSVPKDDDPTQWSCTYFEAEVGDQKPKCNEYGTVPSWHTIKELLEKSMYPDFYKKIFGYMGLL